jgi:hypothetical protein
VAAVNKLIRCQLTVFRKRKRERVHDAIIAGSEGEKRNICFVFELTLIG